MRVNGPVRDSSAEPHLSESQCITTITNSSTWGGESFMSRSAMSNALAEHKDIDSPRFNDWLADQQVQKDKYRITGGRQ